MSQVSDNEPGSPNSPQLQETSIAGGHHQLSHGTYDVKDLYDCTKVMDEFSRCLDQQSKSVNNWQHFAKSLNVPSDIINVCKLCMESDSPTVRLFKYLESTRPDMTVGSLREALTRNQKRTRYDLDIMLQDSDIDNERKISEAITKSNSDIMDQIASKLDCASRPTCTWMDVGLELGISREKLQQFETYTAYNPTEELFRCLYTSSRRVKATVIFDYLEQMNRLNILEEIKQICQSTELASKDAQDIFKLGSELLDTISRKLNEDRPGVEGWKGLARRLMTDHYIDDPDIISKLEPPRQQEIHSPTKKIIEWLTANKPDVTIDDLIAKCEEINRNDAVMILVGHYSRAVDHSHDEPGSPKSRLQGYSELMLSKEQSFKSGSRNFGLPRKPTTKMIGREEKKKELVEEILSGKNCLIILHAATGYGKERLAVETAYELIEKHDHTCIYVDYTDGILTVKHLANKILTTYGIQPPPSSCSDDAEREKVKEIFKTFARPCLLILDNFDHAFHAEDEKRDNSSFPGKPPTSRKQFGKPTSRKQFPGGNTTRKEQFQMFIEDVLKYTSSLTILTTTWESFSTNVEAKEVNLPPLAKFESEELFLRMCESAQHGIERSSISSDLLNSVLECCSGIPQLLRNAVVIVKKRGFEKGADHLANSLPERRLEMLCKSTEMSPKERFYCCLDVCFERLCDISQKVLMMISVLPGFFTFNQAETIFKTIISTRDLQDGLTDLMNFSFLSYDKERKVYHLSPAMRSFPIYKAARPSISSSHEESPASETDLSRTYKNAMSTYVNYTFASTSKIENGFFSILSASAIQRYREQEVHLKEIANWFISDRLSEDPDMKRLRYHIMDSFIQCYLVNIKQMETSLLKTILCKFSRFCSSGDDSKNQSTDDDMKRKYIECLTYGGVTCILGCLCVPHLCLIAKTQAKWCFKEVLKALYSSDQTTPSLKGQLTIVSKCQIMSKGAQTQFLLKYGMCLVWDGQKEKGFKFIEKGIEIRQKVFKDSKSTKDRVMLAMAYNNLANAYSYHNYSNKKAIEITKKEVLPVYQKYLGCHPFTASAFSHLTHNYLAMELYEEALVACKEALSYREKLLGQHSETARSLFDMGHILQKQARKCEHPDEKYEQALSYLSDALKMRQQLAFTSAETMQNHLEIAGVLKSLGREEEAKEHEEKAGDCSKKIDVSHTNLASND